MKAELARIFNARTRVRGDDHPLFTRVYGDRFRWMPLNDLKVSPAVLDRILERRKLPDQFVMETNRKLAVIIPFRNRAKHLEALLPVLKDTLRNQNINHQVFVVEQADDLPFNRAKLLNAGVDYAGDSFDYYCFHDTDLLPVDCCYGCPSAPLRMHSVIHNSKGYRKVSNVNFSGVVSVRREHFIAANGFSNEFWHWGKEDDNFLLRLLLAGVNPAIDTRGTFNELDESSNRDTMAVGRAQKARRDLARELREKNRRRQIRAARGILDESDDGLSSLSYRVLQTDTRDALEWVSIAL